MSKKYELIENDTIDLGNGRKLFRIRALIAIGLSVAAGDLGGYVESERNLAQVSGDARVSGDASFGWFSKVGSENGTLTWYITKDRAVGVNRGCFTGTLDQFEAAVADRHGDRRLGREYQLLVQFIRLRAQPALDAMPLEIAQSHLAEA